MRRSASTTWRRGHGLSPRTPAVQRGCAVTRGNECWADRGGAIAAGDDEDAGLRIAGRDALAAFAAGAYESNAGHMRNWQSQVMISATPEGAEGRCYLMLYRTMDGPAAIQTSGVFTDSLVKTEAGWRFAQRRLRGDGPAQR